MPGILDAWRKPKPAPNADKMVIYRGYDIRGVYPTELNEDTAYKIGRAFVEYLNKTKIVVGSDARMSSPKLREAFIRGVTDQGASVTDIGLCTTPMLYFAVWKYNMDGGAMITASHNPKEYNGMKFCKKECVPLTFEEGIGQIGEIVIANDFSEPKKKGSVEHKEIMDDYKRFVLGFKGDVPKLKIVVDAGNGMASVDFDKVFSELPQLEIVRMYFDIDMRFPNHPASPIDKENMADLEKRVVKEKADLGIAFDGDCDRIFFTDENGATIRPDLLVALLAGDVLKKQKGAAIGYDLRSSMAVKEYIEKAKGKPVETRVGHSYIKKMMREKKIVFAGELSGHFYYKENCYAESSLITILKLLSLIGREKKPLSELISPLNQYFHSGEINFEVKDKDLIFDKMEELHEDGKMNKLDGLKVSYSDWWFNLRKSNTEPKIRLNLEAKSEEVMQQKIAEIKTELKEIEELAR